MLRFKLQRGIEKLAQRALLYLAPSVMTFIFYPLIASYMVRFLSWYVWPSFLLALCGGVGIGFLLEALFEPRREKRRGRLPPEVVRIERIEMPTKEFNRNAVRSQ